MWQAVLVHYDTLDGRRCKLCPAGKSFLYFSTCYLPFLYLSLTHCYLEMDLSLFLPPSLLSCTSDLQELLHTECCWITTSAVHLHVEWAVSVSHAVVVFFLSFVGSGQFQKSCTECKPCPAGSYTAEWNREDRCHRCSGDCRPGKSPTELTTMTAVTLVLLLNILTLFICRVKLLKSRFCTVSAFHLKVAQNCTSKSDVKCICEAGFVCTDVVSYSANCRYCEKIRETTTAGKNGAEALPLPSG